MNEVANRYAEALFDLAIEMNQIDAWQNEMDMVEVVLNENPKILHILKHSKVDFIEKKAIIEKCFASLDRPLYNFVRLLLDKGRIAYLGDICKEFHHLCNESKNIVEGIVYSAYKLNDDEIRALEDSIGKKINHQVELKCKVDDDLILGVKIVIDGKVFDGSMKNRIESMRVSLLRKSR